MKRFQSKRAIVTGASEGVGAEVARRFAREGAEVVLAARTKAKLEAVAAEIRQSGGTAHVVPADLTSVDVCELLVERSVSLMGGVDILVNNAGAHFRGRVDERSAGELATMVDLNARTPIVLSRLVLPLMSGGGAIVNVASIAGKVPLPDAATYSATKFALRAFSIALGQELRDQRITVSLVSPGPIVDTGFLMGAIEDAADVVFAQPMSTAAEVAEMVLDCAHDGKRERVKPRSSATLATLAYLVPGLRQLLEPAMKAKGRRAKKRYLRDPNGGR